MPVGNDAGAADDRNGAGVGTVPSVGGSVVGNDVGGIIGCADGSGDGRAVV